jgi:hypothetical protein
MYCMYWTRTKKIILKIMQMDLIAFINKFYTTMIH